LFSEDREKVALELAKKKEQEEQEAQEVFD